jgi:hypothetical protein
MDSLEFYKLYRPTSSYFSQVNISEEKPTVAAFHDNTNFQIKSLPDGVLLAIPICSIIVIATISFIVSDIWKVARSGNRIVTINHFKQVPCRNCRFFTNNYYLKCAVHPHTALTKQAVDCPDYSPQDEESL